MLNQIFQKHTKLFLVVLVGILILPIFMTSSPVEAGTNSGQSSHCIYAYNYVNSAKTYWYASSENRPTTSYQCHDVDASIWEYGLQLGCAPSGNRVAYNQSYNGFAATAYSGSLTIKTSDTFRPCSVHTARMHPGGVNNFIRLPFKDDSGSYIP